MIATETLPRLSPDAYLSYERDSACRHELVDGYLYAMTGASDRHEEIAANLLAAIHGHLRSGDCRVYGANLKLRVGDDFFIRTSSSVVAGSAAIPISTRSGPDHRGALAEYTALRSRRQTTCLPDHSQPPGICLGGTRQPAHRGVGAHRERLGHASLRHAGCPTGAPRDRSRAPLGGNLRVIPISASSCPRWTDMSIRRFSCTQRLDRSVLGEPLLNARSYLRIAGFFTSSLFEITHEWLAEKTDYGFQAISVARADRCRPALFAVGPTIPRRMTCRGKPAATMRACRGIPDRSLSRSKRWTDDSRKPWSVSGFSLLECRSIPPLRFIVDFSCRFSNSSVLFHLNCRPAGGVDWMRIRS
jgi:hypothetical protein